jgi:hypothetical protein
MVSGYDLARAPRRAARKKGSGYENAPREASLVPRRFGLFTSLSARGNTTESHSGQKGIEFPKRYRVAKIVYRVALKRQNDIENRGKTRRVLCFQKYHIEMTQNNMSRIYNKNNLSRISH